VQVALRMKSKGGTARAGDVIPYIFCLGSGGESSKTGQADKARHPDEVRKADKDCQIGNALVFSERFSRDSLIPKPDILLVQQITITIWPSRFYHRLKDCARESREQIARGLPNVSVSLWFCGWPAGIDRNRLPVLERGLY